VLSPTTEASCKTYDNTAKLTAAIGSAPDATASTTATCPPAVVVLPLAETPPPKPAAPAPAEVLGVQVTLPVTGSRAAPLARIGGIALMLGAMGLLAGTRRKRPIG
jgi:LPXTG-motif cell wall-anchored protein